MNNNLRALLAPRSVAVIGASPRENAAAYRILRNLKSFDFSGELYPINPRYEEVLGLTCYPSIAQTPATPDAVFIAVSAEQVPALVEEAIGCGVRAILANASGFADGGPQGEILQRRITAAAKAAGVAFCGPNNMGLINVHDRICLWTGRHLPKLSLGPVAIISQSGSVAIALSQDQRALGLSYVITAGNEAVCSAADYLQAVVEDGRVKVILLFLETLRDPELFGKAAVEAAERGIRVIALKVGRSESGRSMVAAHTGALAGEDAVYDALFRRYGILRARDLDEMVETAVLLSSYPTAPVDRGMVAITLSGGEAALIADVGTELGLLFGPLSENTVSDIKPAFPTFVTPRNPVDAWGLGWDINRIKLILRGVTAEPNAGTIACAVDAPASGGADAALAREMATACAELAPSTTKRIIFFNNTASSGPDPEVQTVLHAVGIPYLCGMRAALGAIALWSNREEPTRERKVSAASLAAPECLSEIARFGLLSGAGVPMAQAFAVKSADAAVEVAERIGYPVVLKGTSPTIAHKTEQGLVRVELTSRDDVRKAFNELALKLHQIVGLTPFAEVVVQPFFTEGIELFIGIRNDPAFGSITVVGLGGTFVEIIEQVSLRIGPVEERTAREMLHETKAGQLLTGFRGRGPFDIAAASSAVAALSRFGHAALRSYATIEVNPLFVLPAGKGAFGVDVWIETAATS
jgi:acetate---CoA ligase (ADP-forming)